MWGEVLFGGGYARGDPQREGVASGLRGCAREETRNVGGRGSF